VNPVFVALDTPGLEFATSLTHQVKGHVGGVKLGLEFFGANGPAGVRAVQAAGLPVFLDLKLHDIPNSVAGAIRSLAPVNPAFLTVHASGGRAMLEAAQETIIKQGMATKLLAVTVLTSLDEVDMHELGQAGTVSAQVERLGKLVQSCGLAGAVCSPREVAGLRQVVGQGFTLMVPGVRPDWFKLGDQKRVMTPKEAMVAGADYLVIGRPITTDPNPAAAARRIAAEL